MENENQEALSRAVGKNYEYFGKQFEKARLGEGCSFNIPAFLIAPFYLGYRNQPRLLKKYFLYPVVFFLASFSLFSFAFMSIGLWGIILGEIGAFASIIWYVVNSVRSGLSFNKEYYESCLSAIKNKDEKRFGVSIKWLCLVFLMAIGVYAGIYFLFILFLALGMVG